MATQNNRLTPHTDTTPVVVEVARELSGAQWCSRFPGSKEISTLRPSFQEPISSFIWALESANASVKVNATYRPKERAYLMLWSWMIWKRQADPVNVPLMPGVVIEWAHPAKAASVTAAERMVHAYGMQDLNTRPAGDTSLHCFREAIDMNISWSGALTVRDRNGVAFEIDSAPRTGMNPDLIKIGATYGVIKFAGGASDKPHWSSNGK